MDILYSIPSLTDLNWQSQIINVGYSISNIFNGVPTNKITIITNGFGNFKNVFSGFLNDLNRGI